ncbi:hypothetical protein NP493_711g02043 [Ridgeia piscesae]|uniref:Uncharacterized protein n=1 Tax=Ridgeia piscesae TaxID=27915 RepID=A0AAD9KRX9_RIDPI|nr:hypothetical protein NP493_711g02043 [Ridgeia piscesae]
MYIYHDFSCQIHCLVLIRLQDYTRRWFLYKLSGSSDTSAAVSSCISNVVPSMHTDTLLPLLFSASTVCVLYTIKWSSFSSGNSSVTERTLHLHLQTFDFAICPVLPNRKHLSNLNLCACGACLPSQRQHCCLLTLF